MNQASWWSAALNSSETARRLKHHVAALTMGEDGRPDAALDKAPQEIGPIARAGDARAMSALAGPVKRNDARLATCRVGDVAKKRRTDPPRVLAAIAVVGAEGSVDGDENRSVTRRSRVRMIDRRTRSPSTIGRRLTPGFKKPAT